MTSDASYGQVLRSSSIIGGAQAANYIIGLVRVKAIALIVGPAGIGLLGLYSSAIALVGSVSDFGLAASAVREIVRATHSDDPKEIARTYGVLRRVGWTAGLFGWALTIAFRAPISFFLTGVTTHGTAIACLGGTLLLSMTNVTQLALLQGLKRIGDLARANLLGALTGAVCSIGVFILLGENGVAPAIVVTSLAAVGGSWWFSRKIAFASPVSASWKETWRGFSRMAGIGVAFMWCGVLTAGLDTLVRSLIMHRLGLESVGIYQAALTLSGVLANVVVAAMATDFYPRLMSVIHDKDLASSAINRQTEIGVLLALPGLLFVSAFAPFVVHISYSAQFLPAADLLQWMTLGVFARIVSWPLLYIQLAKGASGWFATTHTVFVGAQAGLTLWMLEGHGVVGAAYAFSAAYVLNALVLLGVARLYAGVSWSGETRKLIALTCVLIVSVLALHVIARGSTAFVGELLLTLAGIVLSFRGLVQRLDRDHRLVELLMMVPLSQVLWPAPPRKAN
jgi:PST family polysaccharide transporter